MTTAAAFSEGAARTAPLGGERVSEPAAPLLSVVMPVYNEEAVLAEVIEEALGALAACGLSYELILLDDASTDDSPEILRRFQERQPTSLRVLRNEFNRGIIAT